MTRVADRKGLAPAVRIQWLENDMDANDNEIRELRSVLSKILWAMMGLLITLTTASILLGLNLAVGK